MVEGFDSGMEVQESFRSPDSSEALLLPVLTPCRSVSWLDRIVTSGHRDHRLVVDDCPAPNRPNRGPITPQPTRRNDLRDGASTRQFGEESLRNIRIAAAPKKKLERETLLVYRSPGLSSTCAVSTPIVETVTSG